MKDIQQLIKKNSQEGRYEDIFPKTFIDAVKDRESGNNLNEILSGFNMYFLSYNGSRELTRLQVPMSIRKTGLWITYVLYDKTIVTEWYAGEAIDDASWKNLSNWRLGTNMLVGDISISSDGYWVVNGVVTTTKAQGEQGITPMLRVGSNNRLQVSYTNGSSWVDASTNPVYTQFRVHNNKLEQSVDLGATWIVVSDELAYQFRNSGNKLQVSKDLGVTWEDTSDYIAAWFRFTGTTRSGQADNVGKIQISRDNGSTWVDLSGVFTTNFTIKGYAATVGALPTGAAQGDVYGVGPTYDPSDTDQTNPIYQLYVKDSTGWVNNGRFTSIAVGVVQTTGTSITEVMSQNAVTTELDSLHSDLSKITDKFTELEGDIDDFDKQVNGYDQTEETDIPATAVDKYYNLISATIGNAFSSGQGIFADTHTYKFAVVAGEKYKIVGKGISNAVGLYAYTGNNNIVIAVEKNVNHRETPAIVEITEDGFLYVNLADYVDTDKVARLSIAHFDGMVDDIEEVKESTLAMVEDVQKLNKKVGDFNPDELHSLHDQVNGFEETIEEKRPEKENKYFNSMNTFIPASGNLATLQGCNCVYVKVSKGDMFKIIGAGITANVNLWVTANSDRTVIRKSGIVNSRTNPAMVTIEEGESFLVCNLYNYDASIDGVWKIVTTQVGGLTQRVTSLEKPLQGKTIVCFGDSITEFSMGGKRYSDYIEDITGATVINVGIGGTQLRQRTTPVVNPTTSMQGYAGLDICNLIKACVEQDFTITNNCAIWVRDNAGDDNTPIIARLKAIDWSKVDVVTFFAGTNDWNNGRHLGTSDSIDVNNTLGAINYIISSLMSTYKNVKVYWFTPIVRWIGDTITNRTDATWSDVYTTSEGKTLAEYVSEISNVVKNNHIPVCDMYWTLGWNKYNFSQYFYDTDGTHPYNGFANIGEKMSSFIIANKTF